MASIRRNTAILQRDVVAQNGEECVDNSPSPKLPHSRTHLALRGLMNSVLGSVDSVPVLCRLKAACAGILFQRHSRTSERSRSKGISWKRISFHLFIFFTIGSFMAFTPFFSIDVSTNFTAEHERFPFEQDMPAESIPRRSHEVKKNGFMFDIPKLEDRSSATIWDVGNESFDASFTVPPFNDFDFVARKLLIIVTPTYNRPFQAYYLNRLAHTLRAVPPPVLWIVVEMPSPSIETEKMLRATGVMYRHLVCRHNITSPRKSVSCQRNIALYHIEKHRLDGIVYFADDDQIYSVDLFEEMRKIRRFGTWPIAVLSKARKRVLLQGPLCNGSQVIGWHSNQRSRVPRRFHIGLSGFAFNSTILWDPKRWRRPTFENIRIHSAGKEGSQDESQMQGLADNCSRIMVWHLNLEAPRLNYPVGWLMQKNLEVVLPLAQ
ncbi:putative glucuronosyltransferase [Ananas comosus]|uniref:Glycosyltransferases n=1 Tax=Ananas comosus TaxID=4615 RepID=A0A199VA94_ANACO|nr:putative glucuronosyltransferase [Ananas comosus]